jgi:hypothetical protein
MLDLIGHTLKSRGHVFTGRSNDRLRSTPLIRLILDLAYRQQWANLIIVGLLANLIFFLPYYKSNGKYRNACKHNKNHYFV